ncbi:MAG: hypothetical protein WBB15_18225 [Ornithinimicrobium sp.]
MTEDQRLRIALTRGASGFSDEHHDDGRDGVQRGGTEPRERKPSPPDEDFTQ